MADTYFPTDHTPDEWREMARESLRSERESWERSDTDGFLSQWASATMARLYEYLADLAEKGGRDTLRWVFNAETGEPVENWRWIETRYGSSVMVGRGKDLRFFNPSHARKAAQRLERDRAKGFTWGLVETDVVVRLRGGMTSLRPVSERRPSAPLKVITAIDYEDE